MFKLSSNQRGISLIEVMVAAGISGVIAMATMKISQNAQQGMRNVATKADMTNFMNFNLRAALADNETCSVAWNKTIALNEGQSDNAIPSILDENGNVLVEEGASLTSNNEYRVQDIIFERNGETSCQLVLELDRIDNTAGAAKKMGGRNKREVLGLACSFDPATNPQVLQTCSSTGASGGGHWNYLSNSGVEWLENPYGTAFLGTYAGGTFPPARLSIKDMGNPYVWNGTVNEGMALSSNHAIRWGNVEADNNGIGMYGNAANTCINFQTGTGASPYKTSCTSGTTINGTGDNTLLLNDTTNGNGIRIGTDGNLLGYMRIRPNGGSGIAITNNGDTPGLFVSAANANVGVGNTGPNHKLDVSGNVHASSSFIVGGQYFASADPSWIRMGDGAGGDGLRGAIIRAGDQDRLYVTTAGNVGVGTVPATKLHVEGSVRGATTYNGALTVNTGNGTLTLGPQNTSTAHIYTDRPSIHMNVPLYLIGGKISSYTGENFQIQTAGTTRATFAADGSGMYLANGWLRTYGATGWYNQSYGGGWYMTDTSYVRAYNGKNVHTTAGMYANAFYYNSDGRLKNNDRPIENALDKVSLLQGKTFEWKKTGKEDIGFIAQEVEKVLPSLVNTDTESEEKLKSVKYGNITALLVEALKELKEMVLAAFTDIDELKEENELLKARLDEQEERLDAQEKLLRQLASEKR